MLGSSGVGKSTLANALIGESLLPTQRDCEIPREEGQPTEEEGTHHSTQSHEGLVLLSPGSVDAVPLAEPLKDEIHFRICWTLGTRTATSQSSWDSWIVAMHNSLIYFVYELAFVFTMHSEQCLGKEQAEQEFWLVESSTYELRKHNDLFFSYNYSLQFLFKLRFLFTVCSFCLNFVFCSILVGGMVERS